MNPKPIALTLVCLLLAFTLSAVTVGTVSSSGTIINVPADYPTIQAAINAASAGDTVLVAPRTYYEHITMKPGVTIQGSGADVTTIDGGGSGNVVTGAGDSTITGFTITGGYIGIKNYHSSPTITNNTITGNGWYGIYSYASPHPIITNNTITGNGLYGIFTTRSSSPTITNNTITGNGWVGIHNYYSSPTITNNIITGNGLVGIRNYYSSPTISYNDVWGNGTNYYGVSPGPGDISADPLFVDPAAGDYRLQAGSPAIDAGTNDAPGLPGADFNGNPRVVDGDGDGVAVVDMGAFEFQVVMISATVDIDPDTLNLRSKGKWITAYIELPEPYDVKDIKVDTITLNGLPVERADVQDGVLMVKFDRQAVQAMVSEGDDVELTVTGEVNWIPFEGSDTIRVIMPGKGKGPQGKGPKK